MTPSGVDGHHRLMASTSQDREVKISSAQSFTKEPTSKAITEVFSSGVTGTMAAMAMVNQMTYPHIMVLHNTATQG